ncbi:TetR family transcriptional regulator [Sphingomonas immobilis]|uniref:TetR family transcriptional regulator n=1 Tax=Sphingomonas immobilis TaxID=3063997 RepID=A0ABT8ZZX5_9SPHN|nr:TetR family transcriptional regulator [Sphingomonas sp. CA1-15]MDO7843130.1 TetR family transcriptional regulator [Sphingomonas sp. CA1-15]
MPDLAPDGGGPESRKRISPREVLIDATGALMRERDQLEIPLIDVAERAGVNVALVKYYFGNKRGLLRALLERDLDVALVQLQSLVSSEMSPADKMRIHLAGLVALYFKHPFINRLILKMAKEATGEEQREITDRFLRPMVNAHHKIFEEGVRLGEFRSLNPFLFYINAVGACDQIISLRLLVALVFGIDDISEDLKRRYTRHTIDFLMNGILLP